MKNRKLFFRACLMCGLIGVLLLACADQTAQGQQHGSHRIGTVNFPVSCSQPAQVEFNHAVALLHHMTYPQAREAFQRVAVIDPKCAMAHWGVAMTLFQPLWPSRPGPLALQLGWKEVQQARALESAPREQMF